MSAKHTPGPWRIEGYTRLIGGEVTGHTISHGVNNYADGPEGYVCTTNGTSEADARLIAAAPDLLVACRQAAIQFRFYEQQHLAKGTPDGDAKALRNHEMAKICEAAIAKATGEA